jgi:hypothetical protein
MVLQLLPGMVLSADVVSRDGMLLLPADFVLDEGVIEKLRLFSEPVHGRMAVRIYTNRRK